MNEVHFAIETILDALCTHAATQGEATAYTFLKSDEERLSITFRELDHRARSIASGLLQQAEPGDRALLLYPAGLDFIEAFLGCLYAGVVAVPAYPPKKNRNGERILSIAQDCTPRLLLCTSETKRCVERELAPSLPHSAVLASDESDCSIATSLPTLESEHIAFLQYTSGSTANPKGVMVTHGNMVANEMLIQKYFEFTKDSIVVSWLPMFHDMGLIGSILAPLFVGFPSVLMPPTSFLWRPLRWLQTVSDYQATCTGAPNFAYDLCVARITPEDKRTLDLSSLRVLYNGAEPVRATTLRLFTDCFSECGLHPNAFFPCYGMAETTLLVSGGPPLSVTKTVTVDPSELEDHRIVEVSEGREIVSCGQVTEELSVRIVHPLTLKECSQNEIGEIWVSGGSVTKGYLSCSKETAGAFGFTLAGRDDKWFRTGDYGLLREGELYITGRLKDLIIIRGRNIYPQDIEHAVERLLHLDSPNSVAAYALEVEGSTTIGLMVEASKLIYQMARQTEHGIPLEWQQSLDHFRLNIRRTRERVLNQFEATLSHVCFVKPGTFPRTSSGKLMRSKARELFLTGKAESLTLPMTTVTGVPARTNEE